MWSSGSLRGKSGKCWKLGLQWSRRAANPGLIFVELGLDGLALACALAGAAVV